MSKYELVHCHTGERVCEGEVISNFRDDYAVVAAGLGAPPQHAASTGRIWVNDTLDDDLVREYYPSVYNCEWREIKGE